MKYITLIPWGTITLACDGNIGSGAVRADGPKIEPSAEKTIPLVGRGSCLAIATLPRSRRRSSLRRVRFGIEHLDWPPGDGSKRLAPIQIVYAFSPSDGLLPDSFFDCSKRYELQAVRDTRCDESVESLSYLKSVDVDSGKPLPPFYALRFLDGAPKDALEPDAVLACYILRQGRYRVLIEKEGTGQSKPTTR